MKKYTLGKVKKIFKCDICEKEINETTVMIPSVEKPRQMCRRCGRIWFDGIRCQEEFKQLK